MNRKATTLALASLALAVATYSVLNFLYPFKQAEEVLAPPVTADVVFGSKLDSAPSQSAGATQ